MDNNVVEKLTDNNSSLYMGETEAWFLLAFSGFLGVNVFLRGLMSFGGLMSASNDFKLTAAMIVWGLIFLIGVAPGILSLVDDILLKRKLKIGLFFMDSFFFILSGFLIYINFRLDLYDIPMKRMVVVLTIAIGLGLISLIIGVKIYRSKSIKGNSVSVMIYNLNIIKEELRIEVAKIQRNVENIEDQIIHLKNIGISKDNCELQQLEELKTKLQSKKEELLNKVTEANRKINILMQEKKEEKAFRESKKVKLKSELILENIESKLDKLSKAVQNEELESVEIRHEAIKNLKKEGFYNLR